MRRFGLIALLAAIALMAVACKKNAPSTERTPEADSLNGGMTGYHARSVTNGGTIKGKVLIDGRMPKMQDFEVNTAGCDAGRKNQRFTVGYDGGIGGAVVMIQDIAEGKPMPDLPSDGLTIHQSGCRYTPNLMAAPAGARVTIVNDEDMAHNVRIEDEAEEVLLNKAQPMRGGNDGFVLPKTGLYAVSCDYHPWMNASIVSVGSPYFAITASDGSFELSDVPAGSYTVTALALSPEARPLRDNAGKIIRYRFGDPVRVRQSVTVQSGKAVDLALHLSFVHP